MHVYKRELAVANGTQLYMPAGETSVCWRIGFPQEGMITRLIVRQYDGVAGDYTVDLYDRDVCPVGSGSSASMGEVDSMTQELARIIPQQSVSAGATLLLLQHDPTHGGPWSYRNRNGTFAVPDRAVYLHIVTTADNTGGIEWEVAIECVVGNAAN
jgi:hypothetical protein